MKEIGKIIINKIIDSKGNEQKIRCEQTLAFIDRLTICDDSIWIYYYREMIYWCYRENEEIIWISTEQKKIWKKAKKQYIQMMNFPFWKEKNHPDRIMILSNFSYLCYSYYSPIDNDSIDLLKKWIDEAKSMPKGMLNESEWSKSKMWIERSEIDLKICQL